MSPADQHDHDHDGDDHAGHDHTGHDHAGHDHAGHDHPQPAAALTSPSTTAPATAAVIHSHGGHEHGHGGHHHHHHHGPAAPHAWRRILVALVLVALAILAATCVRVRSGTAVVVTRFGDPVRVLTEPGLALQAPPPINRTIEVDLRLHTSSSGIHGVLTKDGLSIVVQAYVAWRVPKDARHIIQFVRAVGNHPDEAADQLRSFLGSALETISGRFELANLLNTDPSKVHLDAYEAAITERLASQVLDVYGIEIVQVGVERLMLPETTVVATVERMSAERTTVAEEKKANGHKLAGEIRSAADRDARITMSKSEEEASRIESQAKAEAASIYGQVHEADPKLYVYLRSLATLEQVINPSTRLILRTDAAPFRPLVEGPDAAVLAPLPTGKPAAVSTAPAPASTPALPATANPAPDAKDQP
jgi:membrane protease subunit HflC